MADSKPRQIIAAIQPDVGHYHEIMDRGSMMVEIWDEQIVQRGVTQADPRLKEAAEKAAQALMDFYQLAGVCHTDAQLKKAFDG